ncbi:hypothetical protein DM01DRAFT_1330735 [Hesseltinella vesiculosa]|uniref:Uncharacterized protein n=1 Tax=Hesseltinella vesiculosa TaxID=101127 RepID=A0A1X2GX15_9FUNG|nr:hypothetical protein DM01DRAFT_1330735 [Hesseltinella vesiculosa]
MVLMVDLSSSLATIDSMRDHIMLEDAFDLLSTTLSGLVQPFYLPTTHGANIKLEPTISLTVIAECSQFGSNINVIPVLAEYPTMRVLLQNVTVTGTSVNSVLKELNHEISAFQYDLGKMRHQISQRRKVGYQLDVRYDHSSVVVEEGDDPDYHYDPLGNDTNAEQGIVSVVPGQQPLPPPTTKKHSRKLSQASQMFNKRRSHHHRQQQSNRRTSKGFNSWKKDVWGVGKTGSNLSYILRAGSFALSLLPTQGRRSILLITDGVVKSNVDETVLSQLAADNIACHVFHLGPENGFTPSCNFGFVPDTEILQFVANATGGYFDRANQLIRQAMPSLDSSMHPTCTLPPNQYHLRILAKEILLEKPRTDTHRILASPEPTNTGIFPWTTNCIPVPMEMRLLRYHEYTLPNHIDLLIAARLRQGFSLVSVIVDSGVASLLLPKQDEKRTPLTARDPATQQKKRARSSRVTIVLTLQWQPNVTVEYRIRARVNPGTLLTTHLHHQQQEQQEPSQSDTSGASSPHPLPSSCHGLYPALHSPKGEVLIRANATFSDMLKNWDLFQRRMQVMGLVNGHAGMEVAGPTAGFHKVGKLKRLLDRIFDLDAALGTLLSTTSPGDNMDAFYNQWVKLNDADLRYYTKCWYDEASFDLITPTWASTPPSPSEDGQAYGDIVLDSLHHSLQSWASFVHEEQVYVKMLDNDKSSPDNTATPIRFCEVRLFKEKMHLVTARLLFFNVGDTRRHQVCETLKLQLVTCLATDQPDQLAIPCGQDGLVLSWTVNRPLASLLMRDPDHYMAETKVMLQQKQMLTSMWYGNSTLWITGEYIVRNYLYHSTTHWNLQNHGHPKNVPSLLSMAFDFMHQARIEEGFVVLTSLEDAYHYYKEITFNGSTFAVQAYLWKEDSKTEILSELWMEPSSMDGKAHRQLENNLHHIDMEQLTCLVTFDHINALHHDCPLSDTPEKIPHSLDVRNKLLNVQYILQHQLFYLPSLVQKSSFWLVSFVLPKFAQIEDNHLPDVGTPGTQTLDISQEYGFDRWKPSTCICSVHDTTFYKHSHAISQLSSVHRDFLFLHHFMEVELEQLADYQLPLEATDNNYWLQLWHSIYERDASVDLGSLTFGHTLSDMSCFVKSTSATSCLLAVIPSLASVIKTLQSPIQQSLSRCGIMLYQCERPSKESLLTKDVALSIRPVSAISTSTGLQHSVWQAEYSQQQTAPVVSDMLSNVKSAYSKSFVKSLFTSLLHGCVVDANDFERALPYCSESVIDIDITGYLNVQSLLQRNGSTSLEEVSIAHRRFLAVLGHYFEPVVTTNGQHPSIYCYRPAFTKSFSLEDMDPLAKKPLTFLDMVQCAQNPLFVRLECQFKKPNSKGSGWIERTFTFDHVPSSYQQPGLNVNFEPDVIGTDASPVASSDNTTATLRLVCLTLPLADHPLTPAVQSEHRPDCPAGHSPLHHQLNSSYLESKKKYAAQLANLSLDKQDAILETEQRLIWHFTEEILHCLLRAGPVTATSIGYVEKQLMKKNSFVDFPTTMSIPLVFVKNHNKSRCTFLSELEKVTNAPYRLVRVDDAFYAQNMFDASSALDFPSSMHDPTDQPHDDEFHLEGLNISLDLGKSMSPRETASKNDDFCQGLGISLMEPESDDNGVNSLGLLGIDDDHHGEVLSATTDQQTQSQLYWLLLIPLRQSVQIYFYSKVQLPVNRSEIIRVTKNMVKDVMERTNQLVLLQALHNTRTYSKYLLTPGQQSTYNQRDSSSTDDSDSDDQDDSGDVSEEDAVNHALHTDDNLVDLLSTSAEDKNHTPPKKFQPGHFQCPCLLKKRIPLHWRLQPNAALTFLANEVLRFAAVRNQPNMYVMMNDDQVIYCTLSEGPTLHPLDSDSQNDNDSIRPSSPYGSSLLDLNGSTSAGGATNGPHSRLHTASSFSFGHSTPHGSPHSDKYSPKALTSPSKGDGSSAKSPSLKKHSRPTELRELTVEVYGVQFGKWISDFVEMLESRLTTQLTMKEVQQFLTRNPTSKLSRADIEFMLPVTKPPSFRRTLVIPPIINNIPHFLNLLRQNNLVGPLRALEGTDLSSLVRRHRMLRYGSYSGPLGQSVSSVAGQDHQLQEVCLYYSCTSRTPGKCTPFEFNVGEGVAGVCFTVVDEHGIFVTHVARGQRGITIDDAQISEYLRDDLDVDAIASDDFLGDGRPGYRLSIDIWPIGGIDGSYLLDHLGRCFKQTVCDFIVEQIIHTAIHAEPSYPFDNFSLHHASTDLSHSITNTTTSFLQVLDKAFSWDSPTVTRTSWTTQLAPWTMPNILQQLDTELTGLHGTRPVMARALMRDAFDALSSAPTCDDYDIYELPLSSTHAKHSRAGRTHAAFQPPSATERDVTKHYRYMIIGGLPELGFASGFSSRRHSSESYWSSQLSFKKQQPSPLTKEEHTKLELHQRQDSVASSMSKSGAILHKKISYKEDDHHHSFVLFIMDCDVTTAYAYNCTSHVSDQLFTMVRRLLTQQEARHLALNNILYQKMGLFNHTYTMSSILTSATVIGHMQHNQYNGSLSAWIDAAQNDNGDLDNGSATVANIASTNGSPTTNSIVRLAQPQDHTPQTPSSTRFRSSNAESSDAATTAGKIEVNFSTLKSLVINHTSASSQSRQRPPSAQDSSAPTPSSHHGSIVEKDGMSIFDVEDTGRLCKSPMTADSSSPAVQGLTKTATTSNTNTSAANTPAPTTNRLGPVVLHPSASRPAPAALQPSATEPGNDVIYTAVRLADANSVLRDAYAQATTEFTHGRDKDYLMRHGEPFLTIYLRRTRLQAAHDKAFKIYSKWADRSSSHESGEMMEADELNVILKASRLLHFCRTPLLLADMEPLWTISNASASTSMDLPASLLPWYEDLTRTFMKEYAAYLQSVGMHLIVFGTNGHQPSEDNERCVSRYGQPRLLCVQSPVIYLMQVFRGGTVLCEARFTGMFVSATLYTLHRRYGRLTFSPYTHEKHDARRAGFKDFTEECDRFKQRIHVNSFAADFALRYMQYTLDHLDSLLPLDDTSHRHLLDLIHHLSFTFNKQKRLGAYTRNRLVRGKYELDMSRQPTPALLPTLLRNCRKLGMQPLVSNEEPIACFVSSNDFSFSYEQDQVSFAESPFRHSLILTPTAHSPDDDCKLEMCYYILVTYQAMDATSWRTVVHQHPEQWRHHLQETLATNYKLQDVIDCALKRIDVLVEQAIAICELDSGWNRLKEAICQRDPAHSARASPAPAKDQADSEDRASLMALSTQFARTPITSSNMPQLSRFLDLKLPWASVLHGLKRLHPMSGDITLSSDRYSLLIYMGDASTFFVSFEYNALEDASRPPVQIFANHKHGRNPADDDLTGYEIEFLGSLTVSLCYLLWKLR